MNKIFDIDFRKGSLMENVSGNYAVNTSVIFKQAEIGISALFNGSTSKLVIPNALIPTSSGMTISFYAKSKIASTTKQFVLNEYGTPKGVYIQYDGGRPVLYLHSNNYRYFAANSYYNDNKWHHYVFIITGVAQNDILNSKLYIDNILQSTSTTSSSGIPILPNLNTFGISASNGNFNGYLNNVKIYNSVLSPQEIVVLYSDFLNSKPLAKQKNNFTYPKPTSLSTETGLLAAYNMNVVNGNQILDTSGNGKHLTASASGWRSGKDSLDIQYGITTSYFAAASSSWLPTGNFTWQWAGKLNTLVSSSSIFDARRSGSGVDSNTVLLSGVFIRMVLVQPPAPINTFYIDSDTPAILDTFYTIQLRRTGSLFEMYINGILQTDTISFSGAIVYDFPFRLVFGYHVNFRIYNRALSTQEIKDYHNQQAKKITFKEDFALEPADGTNIIPKGWRMEANFKVSELTADDSVIKDLKKGTKQLVAVGAGSVYYPSQWAYGTMEFDYYRASVSKSVGVVFICKGVTPVSDFSGYDIALASDSRIYLRRLTGGGAANLFYTASSYLEAEKIHRIKLTRSASGVFTMYIKGGSFGSEYQLVSVAGGTGTNPVTDNTHGISNMQIYSFDIGCKISNIKYTEGIEV